MPPTLARMADTPPPDTDPAARLASYVDVWWAGVQDFLELAGSLGPDDWSRPTDLPGWRARDVLAHLVHLESATVGIAHESVDIGEAPHVRNDMGRFCEEGVVARRDVPPAVLVDQLREVTDGRRAALRAAPPTDPSASAPGVFGAIGWDAETFFGNRPLDVWTHDQDVRRAVGRPGGLDGVPAAYVAARLLRSLPFVVGKRIAPPAGTSVLLTVGALPPVAVHVGEDGRARTATVEEVSPTATLSTDLEAFTLAAGGRGEPDPERWTLDGDTDLARRVLASLAVMP